MQLTKEEREFLLVPKALPSISHYSNLRKLLPRAKWDKLRKLAYERADHTCELCHQKPYKLEVHELWFFDFASKTQYLKRLVVLCSKCHAFQHALLLRLQVDQGFKKDQHIINHYNRLSGEHLTYTQFYARATREANKYEHIDWTVVVIKDFEQLLGEI